MVVQFGCLVVNAPTANTIAAAEHGIALLCALSRNVAQADKSVKEGKWARKKYVGVSLVDKTLAIIGFGKVGITSLTIVVADGHPLTLLGIGRLQCQGALREYIFTWMLSSSEHRIDD